MDLVEEVKELLTETEKVLTGSARRLFMARTVCALGKGGQRLAERELGWNRGTIRKGQHELEQGISCFDAYTSRGRKRSEEHLPNLLSDMTWSLLSRSKPTLPILGETDERCGILHKFPTRAQVLQRGDNQLCWAHLDQLGGRGRATPLSPEHAIHPPKLRPKKAEIQQARARRAPGSCMHAYFRVG